MCDRFGNCSKDGTYQLVLENRSTGMEVVEYHCKAHLVLRVWEVERDDVHDVLDARSLCSSQPSESTSPPASPPAVDTHSDSAELNE
ncbi:hypothetical protein EA473_03860 [Natrarchaeobius chitinivorans]|uniref:Uncharacterized protein n=1 Tax=Natrarchaeobius chitinivorans TaxID=1679083 RepID=A0A3N6MRD2_NATCH|nr:hypothetical protein [Natrarchaeobius chitinivorans]RQG97216.1 hypothetical protein EA473_03860 [Natrarchaeobius chitinivorans]